MLPPPLPMEKKYVEEVTEEHPVAEMNYRDISNLGDVTIQLIIQFSVNQVYFESCILSA